MEAEQSKWHGTHYSAVANLRSLEQALADLVAKHDRTFAQPSRPPRVGSIDRSATNRDSAVAVPNLKGTRPVASRGARPLFCGAAHCIPLAMSNPHFAAEEPAAAARLLKTEIDNTRWPLSPAIQQLKSALAKLQSETAAPREQFPAPVQAECSHYLRRKKQRTR
jgi:hypothetical protein